MSYFDETLTNSDLPYFIQEKEGTEEENDSNK